MTATTKFYTALAIVLAIIVGVSYYAGYRSGFHAGSATHARCAVSAQR